MSKEKHEIAVIERNAFGKNEARRARRDGKIPVNVYAAGKPNRSYLMDAVKWEALSKNDLNLVYLLDGKKSIATLVREVQFNHLKGAFVHVDFQEVNVNEEIQTAVRVHAFGEAIGSNRGGVLDQLNHEIEVLCKPTDIPEHLTVNVTELNVGDAITAGQVELPANVKLVTDPEMIIFHVVAAAEEAEVAAGEVGAAEPEVLTEKKEKEAAAE